LHGANVKVEKKNHGNVMEIASFNSFRNASQYSTNNCVEVGGSPLDDGNCACPIGFSSTYDALITGNFCSVSTEYSGQTNAISSNNTLNGTESENPPEVRVGTTGILQLVISFSICMFLVCIFRKSFDRCKRVSRNQSSPYNYYYR